MRTLLLLKEAVSSRKLMILFVFVLTTVAATMAVFLRHPSYESSAAVLINVERFGVSASRADVRQDLAVLSTVEAVTSQAEVLRSHDLIERLVDKLDPDVFKRPRPTNRVLALISSLVKTTTDALTDALRSIQLLPPANPRYDMIREIEDGLDVSTVRQAQVIRVSFRAETTEAAQTVLRELLRIYIQLSAQRELDADAPEILQKEAGRVLADLETAEGQLFALRSQYRIADLNAEKSTITDRLNKLIIGLEGAQDIMRPATKALLPEANTPSAMEPPQQTAGDAAPGGDVTGKMAADDPGNSVSSAQLAQLRSQINSLRIERAGLLSAYSADNSRIRAIDSQIETIDGLLQKEIAGVIETVNSYRARLSVLLAIEPRVTQLSRSVAMLSGSYEVYRKAAEDRQIMRQQEAHVQIQVIDEPSFPYAQRGPVRAVMVAGGMGAGLLLGVAVAVLLNFLGFRARDEAQHVPIRA